MKCACNYPTGVCVYAHLCIEYVCVSVMCIQQKVWHNLSVCLHIPGQELDKHWCMVEAGRSRFWSHILCKYSYMGTLGNVTYDCEEPPFLYVYLITWSFACLKQKKRRKSDEVEHYYRCTFNFGPVELYQKKFKSFSGRSFFTLSCDRAGDIICLCGIPANSGKFYGFY